MSKKINHGQLIKKALMTGVSYVIPFVVAGGTIMSLALIFGGVKSINTEGTIAYIIRQYGSAILGLMVPIIAGYISYSIADKIGLAPGMAAGLVAVQTGGGFLGGLIGGLIAGYIMMYIKKIKINKNFVGLMNFFVYPVLGAFVVGIIMLFVIGKPIAAINTGLINWLKSLNGVNAILLGAIIGAMTCFDMGGPVNKAAYAFVIGAMGTGIGNPYASMKAAISVPDFALALSTLLFAKYYSQEELEAGKAAWVLGIAGITEGAIPFAVADPLIVIPSMMVGGAIASAIAMYGGASILTPGGGLFTLPLMKNAWVFIIAMVIGSIVSAVLVSFLKSLKYKKMRSVQNADNGGN